MKKLGIVVSHPIQYYAPLFKYLAGKLDLVVFYCHNPSEEDIGKDRFGLKFKWDTDLLSGYKYVFLNNISKNPSLSNFNGCKKVSTSAVSFQSGLDGLSTGTRSFTDSSDNYVFNSYKLSFANSTGNTTGKLSYKDESTGRIKSVKVSCDVRDYEYTDC